MRKFILNVELSDDKNCDECPACNLDRDPPECRVTGERLQQEKASLANSDFLYWYSVRPGNCPLTMAKEKDQVDGK